MKMERLVRAAQKYDMEHRPAAGNWMHVPDSQVARLLTGALNALKMSVVRNEQRQDFLMPPGD